MRKLITIILAGLLTFTTGAAIACEGHGGGDGAKQEKKQPKKVATATFQVDGMHCGGCAEKVKKALDANAAIVKVDVKVADKRVTVDYDAEKLNPEQIAKLITDLGYPAKPVA